MLLGADSLRSELQIEALTRRAPKQKWPISRCLKPLSFTTNVPEAIGNVTIEPLANRVPAECFYVRFGNFNNYLWFHDTLDRWAGDLKNLFNRRGLDFGITPGWSGSFR